MISSNFAKQAERVQIHEHESRKVLTDLAQRFEFNFKTKFQNLVWNILNLKVNQFLGLSYFKDTYHENLNY